MEFFTELLNKQYDSDTVQKILNGLKVDRVMSFRVNTLKTTVDSVISVLNSESIPYTQVEWYECAFMVDSKYQEHIESLSIYSSGHIYIQSLSSMLPPLILNPKEKITILDMCASPGGKTTELASLTQGKSQITACELNKIRLEKLKYNIDKQGAKSVYVMNVDSRFLDDFYSFDSVLLDAPCSGSGTLDLNNPNTFKYFTKVLIDKSVKAQKALLNKALNVLKVGESLVYSTCSILQCENEDIVLCALNSGRCVVEPIDLTKFKGMELLPNCIDGVVTVCPNNTYEGFFVAKLKKIK